MSRFLFWARLTLILTYGVILAGTVVRATGSGMGCPDWPKCFGKWIPPTDVSQLPPDYKTVYKGAHFEIAEFNALQTWTEYVNRLLGALLGFTTLILFGLSLRFWRKDRPLTYLCFFALFLMGFQGWLGAKVVSSNLAPIRITIHMLVALLILALIICIIHRAKRNTAAADRLPGSSPLLRSMLLLSIVFSVIQIVVGTQVREKVDEMARVLNNRQRETWITQLGSAFEIHRVLAIAVLVLNVFLVYLILYKNTPEKNIRRNAWLLLLLLISEFLVGLILSYFAIPALFQPLHLLLASIIFGIQVYLFISVKKAPVEY